MNERFWICGQPCEPLERLATNNVVVVTIDHMRKLTFLFLCFLHSLTYGQEYDGHAITNNYTLRKLGGQVFNIVQDDRGVMYFGMGKGVVEYDGKYWREIPLPSKVGAFSFAKSKEGVIYVGGTNEFGYLTFDDNGRTIFKDLADSMRKENVIGDVYSARNTSKFVYFHTPTHIFQYEKSKKEIIPFEGKQHGFTLGSFVLDDTYFFSGLEKGLLKIEDNKIVKAPHSDFFKDQDNTTFLFGASQFDPETQLIIGYNPNIHLYSPSATAPRSMQLESEDFFKDNFPYTSTPTLHGSYHFLGSLGKGGILINKHGKILQQYNIKNGINSDEILHAYQDKQQNIWLGLSDGISKTEPGIDLMQWKGNDLFKGDVFYAYLLQDKLFVLTSQEIFVIAPNKNPVTLKGGSTHMQKWGMKMFKTEGSSKLLFAAGGGIYELADDKFNELYQSETGHSKFFIHQSNKNPNRLITNQGNALLSFRYENNRWVEEGVWKEMERDNLRKIAETRDGEIWLGTYTTGLIKVIPNFKNIKEPLKVAYYGLEHGLPSLNRCVPIVYQDKILVGTEKGLYIYLPKEDRFEPYCELGKQFCDGTMGIYHFVEADAGTIYMAPYNGQVTSLKLRKNAKPVALFQPFKRIPEMRIDKIEVGSQGDVWIAGEEGIFRYDASQDTKDYNQPFNCLIRKVAIHNDSVVFWGNESRAFESQGSQMELPYQHRNVRFEFAAPFFDQEEKTLYSYCLKGYDDDWSEWALQTEKEYTNLSEDTYTFMVRAKNVYDVESSIANFEFTILPPWYRTWWAFFSYLVLAATAIAVSMKVYHYRLIRNKIRLQKIIKERTLKIEQQNIELVSQKRKLEIQAKNQKQIIETKDKIFSILGHDLMAPISSLAGLLDLVSQKSISPQVLQLYTDNLRTNVRQVYFTLNNLLFWAKGQMQGLVCNPQLFNLNDLLESNFDLMQEIAFSKRIQLVSTLHQNVMIWADRDQIGIVLRNLLSNALKFTPADGSVRVGATKIGDSWEVFVQDTGVGITDENMAKIFTANVTTFGTDGERGTGLGLSLCREMLQMNGGHIWVVSEVGKGTGFYFTLPASNER